MAGVTWWNFYFRLFPGAIRSPQIIEFLTHLLRHIPGKLLIVWNGLPGHRSGAVWDFVRQQKERLWLEFLPAYAPELNPVEYLWAHWKQHGLPNFCSTTFRQLSHYARQALRRMRRRPILVIAFWQQAELSLVIACWIPWCSAKAAIGWNAVAPVWSIRKSSVTLMTYGGAAVSRKLTGW